MAILEYLYTTSIEDRNSPYLLNDLSNLDRLFYTYMLLKNTDKGITQEDLIQQLKFDTHPEVDEVLRFLNELGLIKIDNFVCKPLEIIYHSSPVQSIDFKLALLKNMHSLTIMEDGWGKNAVFNLGLEYLLSQIVNGTPVTIFNSRNRDIIIKMDNWFSKISYDPQQKGKGGKRISLNQQKFQNLIDIYDYVGMVIKLNEANFSLNFSTQVLKWLITQFLKENESKDIESFIKWINNNYLRIPLIDNEYLPYIFSLALIKLHRINFIKLRLEGDFPPFKLFKIPAFDSIPSKINLLSRPE